VLKGIWGVSAIAFSFFFSGTSFADLDIITRVSVGMDLTCASTTGGVRCWGEDWRYGRFIENERPPGVPLVENNLVALGNSHFCMTTSPTKVQCFGGTTNDDSVPTGLGTIYDLQARGYHTCALSSTGLFCWGDSILNSRKFKPVGAITAMAVGEEFICVSGEKGVDCWATPNRYASDFIPPTDLGPVKQLSAGDDHVCALTLTNQVKCWGKDGRGQLEVPNDLKDVRQVSSGSEFSCAIVDGGANVRCWGKDSDNQATVPQSKWTRVHSITAGISHACAITDTGTHCWGGNYNYGDQKPDDLF
jgi:alpha-tubulin suppressor-like RCC1 family protein